MFASWIKRPMIWFYMSMERPQDRQARICIYMEFTRFSPLVLRAISRFVSKLR